MNHATDQSKDRKVGENANRQEGCTSKKFLGSGSGARDRPSDTGVGCAIRSPSSLLSAIRNGSYDEQQNIDYTVGISHSVNKEKQQGMEVISGGGKKTLDSSSSSSGIRTSKMAMKKGFLDSEKVREKPIYPASGSVEGSGGSKGGSLARVMDKCRVINLNSSPILSQEECRRTSGNSSVCSGGGRNTPLDIRSSSLHAVSGVTEISHVRMMHIAPRFSII